MNAGDDGLDAGCLILRLALPQPGRLLGRCGADLAMRVFGVSVSLLARQAIATYLERRPIQRVDAWLWRRLRRMVRRQVGRRALTRCSPSRSPRSIALVPR
jgi:hypothetical protein